MFYVIKSEVLTAAQSRVVYTCTLEALAPKNNNNQQQHSDKGLDSVHLNGTYMDHIDSPSLGDTQSATFCIVFHFHCRASFPGQLKDLLWNCSII